MIISTQALRVFVSSTAKDLEAYRASAKEVILDLDWHPAMMEHFEAQPGCTLDACRELLGKCDLVLLIVGWAQGWVPAADQGGNGQDSITALEFAYARSRNIPVLALLANKSWPGDRWEDESSKRQWVKGFRDTLNQVAAFFDDEAEPGLPRFRALVKQTLVAHKERLLASQERSLMGQERGAPALDFFGSAREGLLEGRDIPILGSGLYGEGALGSQALAKALLKRGKEDSGELSKERLSLATAAEYRERFEVTRDQFLGRFRKILEQQAREATPPPVFDLLAGIERLPLIVSAVYDRLLEDKLDRAGRKYVVVAHVLRAYENSDNSPGGELAVAGKVVVLRTGRKPEFSRADQIHIEPDECIVYKPLGSPFLHDAMDPDLGIDTVVVTETDHACFLQRLESPETGVPSAIRRRFVRQPLLFLGYTMDVWQYRLTMLVFRVANRDSNRAPTLAVRVPESEMEEVAWNRLNAQLIRMDPYQFGLSASAGSMA